MVDKRTPLDQIKAVVPGGVDGNAKYFEGMPIIQRGTGSRLIDVDGKEYIDFCCGYGPLIFGHDDPELTAAVAEAVRHSGLVYGLPHPLMLEAASLVCECVPCAEMVRFTNSGTEAMLSCIRLSRAVTGRDKIVKFYGAYHGTHESVLIGVKATEPHPSYPFVGAHSAGIPQGVVQDTFVLPFNDPSFAEAFLEKHANEIAAVLVEPVLGSYGLAAEKPFLEALRRATEKTGALLVFDEVITGFRLALGGIQELLGVIPDLVALGKAMAGGFPIGAFAGRRRFMEKVAPTGDAAHDRKHVVYHSGTYNANPVAMAAVKTSIGRLRRGDVYPLINGFGEAIRSAFRNGIERSGVQGTATGIGSLAQCHFGVSGPVRRPEEMLPQDAKQGRRLHSLLLQQGLFFIPGPRGYLSTAHTPEDIERAISVIEVAFRHL
jgi:glutamate-1-semialdehyde 2,1-aminomutase